MRGGSFSDANITIGTQVDISGISQGLKSINKQFKKLGSLVSGAMLVGALVSFGKAAVEAASDLQEVQNIVDVTFRTIDKNGKILEDYTDKIENLAQVSIKQFGLSELAVKQTAGQFAAMGNAMGFTQDEATDMAVRLTELTGDMASFYNIRQEYARVALSAVYTGETETLKRYGIILTEANLQEYANIKGLNLKVKSLDAQNKAILRYNYIMESTAQLQGDFVRTQGSWANQTRVLSELWKQFMITVGNGLVTVLTPLIKVLNMIVQALTKFVATIMSVLSSIFGIKWDSIDTGAGTMYDDITEGAEEATDAQNGLTKATKQYLSPLDEITKLQKETGGGGSGAGGGGALDLDLDPTQYEQNLNDMFDPEKLGIDNLYDLGKWISDKIGNALDNIPWKEVKEKAKNFGKNFATFLNGLIQPKNFKKLGKTIAECFNTGLANWSSYVGTFDWKNFGKAIGASFNSFAENFNFALAGTTATLWATGIIDTVSSFLKEVKPSKFLNGFTTFLQNIKWKTLAKHLREGLKNAVEFLNDGIEASGPLLKEMGKTIAHIVNMLVESASTLINDPAWDDFAVNIKDGIMEAIRGINWEEAGKTASDIIFFLPKMLASAVSAMTDEDVADVSTAISDTIKGLLQGAIDFLTSDDIDWYGIGKAIHEGIDNLKNDEELKSKIWEAIGALLKAVFDLMAGLAPDDIGEVLGISGFVTAIVAAIGVKLVAQQAISTLTGHFKSMLSKAIKGKLSGKVAEEVGEEAAKGLNSEKVKNKFAGAKTDMAEAGIGTWLGGIGAGLAIGGAVSRYIIAPLAERFGKDEDTKAVWGEFFDNGIKGVWDEYWRDTDTEVIDGAFALYAESVRTGGQRLSQDLGQGDIWSYDWTKGFFDEAGKHFGENVPQLYSDMVDALDAKDYDEYWEKFKELGENIGKGVLEGMKGIGSFILETVQDFFTEIGGYFAAVFGIHSPATEMEDTGENILLGVLEGFKKKFTEIPTKVQEFFTKLTTKFTEKVKEFKEKVVEKFNEIKDKVVEIFTKIKDKVVEKFVKMKDGVVEKFVTMKKDFTEKAKEIKDNIVDKFKDAKSKVVSSFKTMKEKVVGVFDKIKEGIKSPINAILGFIQSMVNGVASGINNVIDKINSIKVDFPDWVPIVGGKSFGTNIPKIPEVTIPKLAAGAVIPPNKEFMAILGDQKSGNNIEAPESLIRKIMQEELANSGRMSNNVYRVEAKVGRRVLFETVIDEAKLRETTTARNPFALA